MQMPVAHQGGRPRQPDVDDVPARALKLFRRAGYRTTTTREVDRPGITQSSLHHAFGSKAELLDAVLDRYQTAVEEFLLEPLHADPDGRGCLMVNMMADEAPIDPEIADRTRARPVRAAHRRHPGLPRGGRTSRTVTLPAFARRISSSRSSRRPEESDLRSGRRRLHRRLRHPRRRPGIATLHYGPVPSRPVTGEPIDPDGSPCRPPRPLSGRMAQLSYARTN